jgi:hypothetical protein
MHNSTLSLTSALDGGCVVNATPRRFTRGKKDLIPIVQEAGCAPGSCRRMREFDPTTVQPIANGLYLSAYSLVKI